MKIGPELPTGDFTAAAGTTTPRTSQGSVQGNVSSNTAQKPASAEDVQKQASEQSHAVQELDLSFRKDSDGITYYVLTDPQSGQIVREIPPKEVRQVSGGIEEYLKAQAALAAHKTDSKA